MDVIFKSDESLKLIINSRPSAYSGSLEPKKIKKYGNRYRQNPRYPISEVSEVSAVSVLSIFEFLTSPGRRD